MRYLKMKLPVALLTLLALAAGFITARAQTGSPPPAEPLILTDEQGEYPLGLHLEILEDPTGVLTIDQVSSSEFDSQFTPSQVAVPNYGFTDSVYWVRFDLHNQSRRTDEWLLEVGFANMQYVDLYIPRPGGAGFDVRQSGNLRPVSARDVFSPRMVFILRVPSQGQQTTYLRFQSGASMTLPLALWSQAAFFYHSLLEHIMMGLFYGILIGLLLYNLFLLFSLREASYLYFVILLASLILEELSYDGYLPLLIPPNLDFLKRYFEPLSFALLVASMILFADTFLELKQRHPKLHRLNQVILAVWGGLVLLVPFTSYHFIANLAAPWALLSLLAVLWVGIASWRRGFRPARFFLIAWVGMLISVIWALLIRLGLASSTVMSENAYRLGIVWMVVCWSIALADRINLLKAEADTANRNLRSSEHRLAEILEGLPLGVVVYGQDHKPNYANQRSVELLSNPDQGIQPGISAGRTLMQAVQYFSLKKTGSDQAYPMENSPIYSALQGEAAAADDIEAHLGDKRVPLEIWASPVRDGTGNVESAVVAFQDITRRKQVESELGEHRKHLESLVEKRTAELSAINEQLVQETAERKTLELILYQRIEWLSAVNRIHQTIGGAADLPLAYNHLFALILRLLDVQKIFLLRWESQAEKIEFLCHPLLEGLPVDLVEVRAAIENDAALRSDLDSGKCSRLSNEQAALLPAPLGECFRENDLLSLVLAPLIARQSLVGVLGLAVSQARGDFTLRESDLVEKIALDLADLSDDAILLDQARALAMVEERSRLASELHDSVTQVLFSASLVAEVLPQIWQRDPKKAFQSLEELRGLTRGALAEMRTLLLELRPSAVINTPLGELLAQLTEAVTSRSKLPFQLFIEQIPLLPENVQVSFYRVAQETLNNIVRHAQARLVTVSLSAPPLAAQPGDRAKFEVKLVIEDDGVGFHPGEGQREGLGMGIMRERAAAVQAYLAVDSKPGYGTRVILIWRNGPG